ncbi:MAG: hypothetical protein GXP50_06725, partial [Deltaproteobacteria bacterium]|nr:hypothetical protein [Deltaproteobacteria bacterium]
MAAIWVRAILLGICLAAGALAGPAFLPGDIGRWAGMGAGLGVFLAAWGAERWVR